MFTNSVLDQVQDVVDHEVSLPLVHQRRALLSTFMIGEDSVKDVWKSKPRQRGSMLIFADLAKFREKPLLILSLELTVYLKVHF